jgi:hypothetical protein
MKPIVFALMMVLPMSLTDGPPSHEATAKDYREVLRMLKGIDESLDHLDALVSKSKNDGWPAECRELSPEKTVRCAAAKFDPPGGAAQAVAVWSCESNFGVEPPHTDSYHGPFQYAISTYQSQQASMPDVVDWYDLSPAVHDVRSNILTAVAWSARNSWSPWSCA